MNKKIKRIASYIQDQDSVIDIGCDQALLGEYLAKKSIFSVASDINQDIIKRAQKRLEDLKLHDYVKFCVSDGFKNVEDAFDVVVISGMGTYTILDILKQKKINCKKIITISHNNHDVLRIKMNDFGYKIDCEEIIFEKNKYYNLIVFIKGNENYSKEEMYFGKNHVNKELLYNKLKYEKSKLVKIYKKNKNKILKEKVSIIEKMLKCH